MTGQQQLRRKIASQWSAINQQIPWQVSVGAAFCLTVICCAKKRRGRAKKRKGVKQSTAAPTARQARYTHWLVLQLLLLLQQDMKHRCQCIAGERFVQIGLQGRATDDLAEVTQEGKGSAARCQLPLLAVPLLDEALNCSIKQLWRIICKPDPAFQATIHRLSGNRDIQYGDWQQQGGSLVREEQYINPLKKNSFGPTEALCIDRQQCTHRSAAGFVIERRVHTPKVPFGGSFYNLVQWCAWSDESSGKVRLQVSCDVVYTKRWVPAKGIINSSSIEGMARFYKMWLQQLHRHLQLHSSPSQSVATLSPPGHSQTALKRSPKHVTWNTDNILPWLTLLVMALWLIYQSWRQSHGYSSDTFGPVIEWSRNNASLPNVVPVNYTV